MSSFALEAPIRFLTPALFFTQAPAKMQRRGGCVRKKMHLKVGLPVVSLLAFGWVPDTGRTAERSAAGLWDKLDASGKPEGCVRITERNGAYEGHIVRIFPKQGQ